MRPEDVAQLVVERQVKQAQLSDDRTSDWGSDDHVSDLERRVKDAAYWRDKHPKGSEKRSHYRNVYNHISRELKSVMKKREALGFQAGSPPVHEGRVLKEGGLVGELAHLYDNRDLPFGEMKQLLKNASMGRLEKVTEKMDGMNLVFSYDLQEDKLKVTRGSDIKAGGMDAKALASKFFGRGTVEEAFTKAFAVLDKAIRAVPDTVRKKVFGRSSNLWYSMEIIYTKNPNVINYDSDNIVFHGWPVFKRDDSGEVSRVEDTVGGIDILTQHIDLMQQAVNETGWRVRGPAIVKMRDLSNGSVYRDVAAQIDNAMATAGVSDSETIEDYLRALIEEPVGALNLPTDIEEMVVLRILDEPGAPSVNDIKKLVDKPTAVKVSQFVKDSPAMLKEFVRPLELAINDFAVKVLEGLESSLIGNTPAEVDRLRREVSKAISAIESSADENQMTVLRTQMAKLKSIESISSPMEGVVFIYKGNAYKLTGGFASANRILGLFKYRRGKKAGT